MNYKPEDTYYFSDEIICGLDLSLNETGVVILKSDGSILHQEAIDIHKENKERKKAWKEDNKEKLKSKELTVKNDYDGDLKGMERLRYIKFRILHLLQKFKATKVSIEGYSFASKGRAVFNLGELGGIVRLAIYEYGLPYLDVSPTSTKAFISSGNADKEQMRVGILEKYGHNFDNDNIADAFALARFLLCFGDSAHQFSAKGGSKAIKKLRESYEIE